MKRVKAQRYMYLRGQQYWFRRGVPVRLRGHFGGRREVQVSLRTANLIEARQALAAELQKFELVVAAASVGRELVVTHDDAARWQPTSQEVGRAVRAWFRDRRARSGRELLGTAKSASDALAEVSRHSDDVNAGLYMAARNPALTTRWIAEALIDSENWCVEPGSDLERSIWQMVGRGQQELDGLLRQDIKGEPTRYLDATFAPDAHSGDDKGSTSAGRGKRVTLQMLLDQYLGEAKLAAATEKAWRRLVTAFEQFLPDRDARAVTPTDIVRWKDYLGGMGAEPRKPLDPKTINDTYLAALRAVYRYGVENGLVENNPTTGVQVRRRKRQRLRAASFTDQEAQIILEATLIPASGKLSSERASAVRWVPWLCAYTGARVNEITQLRREDVANVGGLWTVRITPEAGSTKNHEARTVPLHPHLIEQGFPKFISTRTGPIFYDASRHRGGKLGNPQYKKVAEFLARWVRGLGITDTELRPNHAWRHKFKTLARRHNLDPEIRDAIQGHSPRTEGEAYGEVEVAAMFRELSKLPRFAVARLGR